MTAELIFGDIGLYPSGDIDILVPMKDIGMVKEILETEEYHLNDQAFNKHKEFFLKELYHISLSNSRFHRRAPLESVHAIFHGAS